MLNRNPDDSESSLVQAARDNWARFWDQQSFSSSYLLAPDFKGKIKQFLRSARPRTTEALLAAIATALDAVVAEDAQGWFDSCGYRYN